MKVSIVGRMSSGLLFLGTLVALAAPAPAQSLTRLQLPRGGQHSLGIQVAAMTDDERYVFVAVDDGFVLGDANGFVDVAVYDMATGEYALVVTGAGGVPADQDSSPIDASTDGRYVLFTSDATNLGPVHQNGMTDLFLRDTQLGLTTRVSLTAAGAEPNGYSGGGGVTNDGRYVVFESEGTDIVPGDTNGALDVFLRDLTLGTTVLLSAGTGGAPGNDASVSPQISIDGRYVMFLSRASDLVPGDTNAVQDLFRRDLQTGTLERVNLGPGDVEANGETVTFSMCQSGELVAFDSLATNLTGQPAGPWEVYVHDHVYDSMARVSQGIGGQLPNAPCSSPRMSGDSGWVTFVSSASNLDGRDTDAEVDAFYVDLGTGYVEWISHSTSGAPGQPPSGQSTMMETGLASYTGGYVFFYSNLEGLVAGDTNRTGDTFLWNQTSSAGPTESFCNAKVNSLGCTPTITSGSEPRTTGPLDAFFVSAHDVRNNEPGILLWSFTPGSTPFHGGTLCLGPAVRRTGPQVAGGNPTGHDCTGTFSFHFSQAYMAARGITPGPTVYAQYWSRDNGYAPPNNVGLTGGLLFNPAP